MKKVVLAIAILGGLTFASCKKCEHCHYDTPAGEVEIGELCDEELENAEANGYSVGDSTVTIHCEDH